LPRSCHLLAKIERLESPQGDHESPSRSRYPQLRELCSSFDSIGLALHKTPLTRRTIFEAWLGIFLWSVLNCVFFPLLFFKLGYKDAFDCFPDMPGVMFTVFLGWVFGLELVAAIALVQGAWSLIIWLVRRFKKPAAVLSEPPATSSTKPPGD
jgi:hypothetical protein